ncbi:uncharacterized protein PADG_08264 [Paracoccidioides brasiliensis Pb18]|uniref:J domain-containing protein n=1 Tax=Paracoccidioides brasiliensis (strain Pb18) TaxID=502780 RepID=C1GLM3_PARBD|nr:uncharacterized protein PADG_08264 [Paracoccidioides brasiliensis Pb18]EEH43340.2 hypothetical protein PADG_08264 [Paracoccidioides brasiliensis Pb18]
MPLCLTRLPPFPALPLLLYPPNALAVRSFFHTAAIHARSHSPSYYDILNVSATATTAEIKKQFYALSLAHHPDKNPNDPTAHAKFSSISSAYHVLSHATRRANYDREHHIHQPTRPPYTSSHHCKAASYVGSRPPFGLSKQRGEFHGPPPSFYAHGGYGAGRHHPHHHPHQTHTSNTSSTFSASTASSDPIATFIYHNPISHFDAQSHFRTQLHEDERRRVRRQRAMEREKARIREQGGLLMEDADGSMSRSVFAILAILGLGTLAASLGKSFIPAQPTPAGIPRKEYPATPRTHSTTKGARA